LMQPTVFQTQVPERPQPKQAPKQEAPSAAPRRQTMTGVEPLTQFHRPIVLPDKPKPEIRDVLVERVPPVAETTERGSPTPAARSTGSAAPAVAPVLQRSEARIALPDSDAVAGLAEPSRDVQGAFSTSVVGIFLLGAALLLIFGWFGVVFLRGRIPRR